MHSVSMVLMSSSRATMPEGISPPRVIAMMPFQSSCFSTRRQASALLSRWNWSQETRNRFAAFDSAMTPLFAVVFRCEYLYRSRACESKTCCGFAKFLYRGEGALCYKSSGKTSAWLHYDYTDLVRAG